MEGVFHGIGQMLSVMVVAMVIVMLAMVVDLVSGINKAKANGQMRTSWGLKRTLSKFIMYEGSMLIAGGVDVLMHTSHLYELFHLEAISGVPFITCLVGAFLCIVEFLSVRESADVKTQKEMSDTARMLGQLLSKEELASAIKDAIKEAKKK